MKKIKISGRKIGSMILFLIFLGVVGLWTANRFLRLSHQALSIQASSSKKFMSAWDEDLAKLNHSHILPDGFNHLRQVQFSTPSEELKKAFKNYPLSLKSKSGGSFKLEIFADEIEGGGIMVQYDLVELHGGNTIWELGRTFPHKIEEKKSHGP